MSSLVERKLRKAKTKKATDVDDDLWDNHDEGGSDFVFQCFILGMIYILAFATRLFSVIRFESVIHEFDPWFNYRVTRFLVKEGFYDFHNWFDDTTWYPLGRYIGGTLYPGLMWTAGLIFHVLNGPLRITVDIRNVCVMLAPFMASNTTIAVYLLTKECWTRAAGIVAAMFVAIAPGYISRSVAGSYDNEAVAIFALVATFYLWVKAVNTGSLFWAAMCSLAYFYMVASWGGYIFIINIIPFHVFVLLVSGRYSHRLYVAYCTFFVLGTLMSMNIQFVQFIPVTSPEHLASIGIFGVLQLHNAFFYLKANVPPAHLRFIIYGFFALLAGLFLLSIVLAVLGYIPFLTGRLLSLLGSTKNIAIVKSVSEHQPSAWTTFFFDLHCLTFFVPVGIFHGFKRMSDGTLFAILYIVFSAYFASIMVRLVLVMAPAACVVGAIGVSETFVVLTNILASDPKPSKSSSSNSSSSEEKNERAGKLAAALAIAGVLLVLWFYVVHCTYVTSVAYSSPSVVLQARHGDGSRTIFDDFREAYYWLWQNTPEDAKIMSWWDYGYQIKGMGNRTVIVDNNTRNNTHIATVGLAMASTEEMAYPILKSLDVDYVLVVFGGMIGYSSDDINKFLWMVRISGGVFPRIVESDFFSSDGQYRVDASASKTMKNCLMYKMCYYRFGELVTDYNQGAGYDRVRRAEIGVKNIKLKHLEEAFTTEHWMVRIYRVKYESDDIGGPNFPRLKRKSAKRTTKKRASKSTKKTKKRS